MDGLDALWAVEEYLPLAILFDLVVLQFALRWGHRKYKRRQEAQACRTSRTGHRGP